jgi:hypothetical protein
MLRDKAPAPHLFAYEYVSNFWSGMHFVEFPPETTFHPVLGRIKAESTLA